MAGTAKQRVIVAAALVGALLIGVRLVPTGPTAIHDPALFGRIVVCGRDYHEGGQVATVAQIRDAQGSPPVLVDPSFFAPCPGRDAQGDRPCSRDASAGPCATVVYVRVGEDAYLPYELSGGP